MRFTQTVVVDANYSKDFILSPEALQSFDNLTVPVAWQSEFRIGTASCSVRDGVLYADVEIDVGYVGLSIEDWADAVDYSAAMHINEYNTTSDSVPVVVKCNLMEIAAQPALKKRAPNTTCPTCGESLNDNDLSPRNGLLTCWKCGWIDE